VEKYQNISLYETIDFGKPSSGMTIGMMPAKLAHILVNIGVAQSYKKAEEITVRDPFCGF
jgi:tRNA G10  N-methylase Trm11